MQVPAFTSAHPHAHAHVHEHRIQLDRIGLNFEGFAETRRIARAECRGTVQVHLEVGVLEMSHLSGKYTYNDGTIYDGEWVNGLYTL